MHILDIRGRLLFLGSRGHRSIAVVLQVVGAFLRVGGLEVGVLVGVVVVVGQGCLAELSLIRRLGGEWGDYKANMA